MKGAGISRKFSMHSVTKFKCNFAVIGVVHSGIKMTGSYFVTLDKMKTVVIPYKFKGYPKSHALQQYAQMMNLIIIVTKGSPKWYWDGVSRSTHVMQEKDATVFSKQTTSCLLLHGIGRNYSMGRFDISASQWSSRQIICRWQFTEISRFR